MLKFYWDSGVRECWLLLAAIVVLALSAPFFQVANLGMVIPIVMLLTGASGDLQSLSLPFQALEAFNLEHFSKLQLLTGLIVIFAALLMAKSLLTVLRCYIAVRLLTFVRFSLTERLFYRYMRASYEKQLSQPGGATQHQVWDTPIRVAETMRAGSELLANGLQFFAIAALMVWISWKLTLLTILLSIAASLFFDRVFRTTLQAISVENEMVHTHTKAFLAEMIAGVRQIKAHAADHSVTRKFHHFVREIDRLDVRFNRLRYWPGPLNELFIVGILTFLFLVTSLIPSFRIEVPYLVAFFLALVRLGPITGSMAEAHVSLHAASRSVEVVKEFLREWPEEESEGRKPVPATISELKFNNVSFVYPSRPTAPILKDLSLCFRVGNTTAIVGASGAGKSTVADLIIRLFSPLKGSIEADDVDIRQFDLASWRREVGFVGQEAFLFNASIRDNIALSHPTASDEAVMEAARLAHIHEFIVGLPDRYGTIVGDRGLKLSGGQRQRIAIARTLMTSPRILVFDEATSALDNISERIIQDTINDLRIGRIVIVIAHRLSTIVHADNIVVLDRGRVVEQGTHRALLLQQATYAKLYSQLTDERVTGSG